MMSVTDERVQEGGARLGEEVGWIARALLACVLVAGAGGCVTTAAIARPNQVSLPLLVGATVADFVAVSLIASQAQDFSAGASVATGLAVTAVDVGAGCILGACRALRP
jgi:hypothetical protein